MEKLFKNRLEFNKAFKIKSRKKFGLIKKEEFGLEFDMINEEIHEYIDACDDENKIEVADAIGDMLYLIIGIAFKHGLNEKQLSKLMQEIHRSNMSKLHNGKIVKNENGKVVKPKTFSHPKILKCLY